MPQYRFLTHDGRGFADLGFSHHPDLDDARSRAVGLAAGVMAERGASLDPGQKWIMAVTDPEGVLLFRVVVAVLDASMADRPTQVDPRAPVA